MMYIGSITAKGERTGVGVWFKIGLLNDKLINCSAVALSISAALDVSAADLFPSIDDNCIRVIASKPMLMMNRLIMASINVKPLSFFIDNDRIYSFLSDF